MVTRGWVPTNIAPWVVASPRGPFRQALWTVQLFVWHANKRNWRVSAANNADGAIVARELLDAGQRKAISAAHDLTTVLGGHRRDGRWVIYCDIPVPGWESRNVYMRERCY